MGMHGFGNEQAIRNAMRIQELEMRLEAIAGAATPIYLMRARSLAQTSMHITPAEALERAIGAATLDEQGCGWRGHGCWSG
jgi:hypothetical protein